MQRNAAKQRVQKKAPKRPAQDEPALARDEEVDAGLAVLDEQSLGSHAIALDMCDVIAETTVRLNDHARRVDAQTAVLAAHTHHAAV